MENKGRYDKLFVKYLAGELSRKEEAQLQEWMKKRDEHRSNLESLQRMWSLLQMGGLAPVETTDAEWLELKTRLGEQEAKVISLLTGRISAPETQLSKARRPGRNWLRMAGIAAAVLIVLGGGLKWYQAQNLKTQASLAAVPLPQAEATAVKREVNNSEKAKTLMLEDGSTVVLFANSELTYRSKFSPDKRDIVLTGKAQFAVAEDKSRPFAVYAGDIRTADIGTIFTVTAYNNDDNITVAVEEGKVLVNSVDPENRAFAKEVLLTAGEQMIYNRLRKIVRLSRPANSSPETAQKTKRSKQYRSDPQVPKGFRDSWFMFNNQPLAEIFESLEQMYGVTIHYDAAAMKKAYFIGRFNKSDSLQTILQRIALLNNLVITKENETFIVKHK